MFFLFRRKERTKEKSFMSFSRKTCLVQALLEGYIREAAMLSCVACFAQSQRRLLFPCLRLTLAIICIRFGIPRMNYFCLGSFPPAPCSPPLGGSGADSAVRFTPAVKYGGRENWPFRRETRCMSGHPYRAHHKLKWARKFGRYTRASV